MTREGIREQVEENLRGDCACDYITKKEMMEYLADIEEWLKTAKNNDKYYYNGNEYELIIEYELVVWQNAEQREIGEPIYMKPTCSSTDLEAIKREVEKYNIESTGCVEIIEVGDDESILHYENNVWEELS